jgi:hypothetical protein
VRPKGKKESVKLLDATKMSDELVGLRNEEHEYFREDDHGLRLTQEYVDELSSDSKYQLRLMWIDPASSTDRVEFQQQEMSREAWVTLPKYSVAHISHPLPYRYLSNHEKSLRDDKYEKQQDKSWYKV